MAGKKFRFSLASVLKLRTHEAERAQDRLAQVLRRRDALLDRLRDAESSLGRLVGEDRRIGSLAIITFVRSETARKQATAHRDRVQQQLERVSEEESVAREFLATCMQKQEALNKLKESELEQYWEEIRYTDQQALDEQGFIGFLQQRQKAHI
jgi:flagellar FliJ protein